MADLSLARLLCANILTRLGQFEKANPHATEAYEGFRPLAADDPGQFWDCLLAAANALSIALSQTGKAQRAGEVIGAHLDRFVDLATGHPHLFGGEFVAYLVSYSAALGEGGNQTEAIAFAKDAAAWALRLKSILGIAALRLEGLALNNLFNRQYDVGDFSAACKTARKAIQRLRQLPASSRENQEDLVRAMRNHAEGLRMTSRTQAQRMRAVDAGRLAVESVIDLHNPESQVAQQLTAQCHSTFSQCQADAGELTGAINSEMRSLEIRRRLFTAAPAVYRRGIAFSLRLLAFYEISDGDWKTALRHIGESIRHYKVIAERSEENIDQHLAEALRVRARCLEVRDLRQGALRSLRAAVDLLIVTYAHHPGCVREQLFQVVANYAELRMSMGLEVESDIVELIREERSRQESKKGMPVR